MRAKRSRPRNTAELTSACPEPDEWPVRWCCPLQGREADGTKYAEPGGVPYKLAQMSTIRDLRRILHTCRTIAVVGLSRDPSKASHAIPARMQQAGFRIIPVNPLVEEELGEKAYKKLLDVPPPVDVVLVFRPSAEAADVARQAVAIGAKALWLQQGIVSDEARRTAEAAGLLCVEDRCIGVERAVHQIVKR